MVGRTDDDNVDIFVVDQFPPVFIKVFNFLACDFLSFGRATVENFVVDVA